MEVNWEQVERLSKVLAKKLSHHVSGTETLIAVPRGGLIVAGIVTYYLDFPQNRIITSSTYPWTNERVVVIDDIADTGSLIHRLRWDYRLSSTIFATLLTRHSCPQEDRPEVFVLEYPGNDYVRFPWEQK